MKVNILNPKATRLLKDLADLNLIAIQDTSPNGFIKILKKLRAKAKSAPSLEEITKTDKIDTVVVSTHALIKKTDKTPKNEIEKAEKLRQKYFAEKNKKR